MTGEVVIHVLCTGSHYSLRIMADVDFLWRSLYFGIPARQGRAINVGTKFPDIQAHIQTPPGFWIHYIQ